MYIFMTSLKLSMVMKNYIYGARYDIIKSKRMATFEWHEWRKMLFACLD